ncbi:MAG: SRPBCC family protein [Thermomicrobiales bacterium]
MSQTHDPTTRTPPTDHHPVQVEMDGPIWLKLRMEVPPLPPEDLLRWFTDPARLRHWMGDEHVVDLVPGGRYAIHYARAGRTMEGAVIVARPTELVFSWAFTHEPDAPARVVMVRALASEDGAHSAIVVIHGPYRNDADDDTARSETRERAGHLAGWNAFLPVLHARLVERAVPASTSTSH